jgi:hypothetical protein
VRLLKSLYPTSLYHNPLQANGTLLLLLAAYFIFEAELSKSLSVGVRDMIWGVLALAGPIFNGTSFILAWREGTTHLIKAYGRILAIYLALGVIMSYSILHDAKA